ncbi:MAG: HAMP domain-containing histidine kinase [Sulfuritalea sp.]|jgi:signal transduction histidine kinase|nr:HAMP domain-containing histidine kinase [Sulfuritalea sp.]
MDVIDWFVPPAVRDDPRSNTRHRGIAKSLLTISLVVSLMLLGVVIVRGHLPAVEYALFAAGIFTPVLGALLIRATADITLGLVVANFGGVLIIGVWAFLTGGINSIALPGFLANLAMQSTFGNVAILLVTGAALAAALLFLYLATTMGWVPVSFIAVADEPGMMLTSMLGSAGMVVLAGVVVARDRARVKAHLRQAQHAAEQSSRAKAVFLRSMSHEFRAPLEAIRDLAERMGADREHPLSDVQQNGARNILAAGLHLGDLLTQVLEMSRAETSELSLKIEPVVMERVVAPCLSIIELEAQKNSVRLVNDCGAHAGSAVWADRVQVKEALLNLLSNAVKFNRVGGTVTVSCQPAGAAYLRILVADTGVGIARERQHQLFDPFSRLGLEEGAIQGVGLGLVTAKRLIERMRGRIGFESIEGLGSTFWVELPLAEADAAPG